MTLLTLCPRVDRVTIALLTAQRRGEITGMRWSELYLTGGWWTTPGERTKNGLAHRVPLSAQVLQILEAQESGRHDPVFVFRGGRKERPLVNPQKPLRRLKQRRWSDFRIASLSHARHAFLHEPARAARRALSRNREREGLGNHVIGYYRTG